MSYASTKVDHIFDPDERCWCVPKVLIHEMAVLSPDGDTIGFEYKAVFFHFEDGTLPRGHRRRPRTPNYRILGK